MMAVDTPNLRKRFIAGTAWMVALRWVMKGIGLINTVILARLLTPEDFGLIAMSVMVVGFIDIWFAFGVDMALIQNQSADRDDYDTAWTLRTLQGVFVGLCLLAVSPLAADYFNEPRVTPLLWIMALCTVISGTSNIGIVDFRKQLNFRREFAFNLVNKLAGFIITIILAYLLRNYWAMVAGIVVSYVSGWVMSYVMHPYRPRFTLCRFGKLWHFSKWMLLVNAGIYVSLKVDELIAARLASPAGYGIYNVSSDLGQMPTNELSLPVSRVLVPLLSKLQDEAERLWGTYLKIMAGVNTVTLPAGIGMALVAPQLVPVFLGGKWLEAVDYVQVFALYGAIRFVYSGANNVLTAQGKIRMQSSLLWFEVLLLAALCIPAGLEYGLMGIAKARFLTAILMGIVTLNLLYRLGGVTPLRFFSHLVRPLIASLAMVAVLLPMPADLTGVPLLDLLGNVMLGAATYGCVLLLLWHRAGKPDGAERIAMSALQRLAKR